MKILIISSFIAALAYGIMYFLKIPVPPFLEYESKDVVIALGGIILGVIPAIFISIIVAALELMTLSQSGLIGFFMNITSTLFFIIPICLFYKRGRTLKATFLGCVVGIILLTVSMVLFNYIISPIYMGVPKEEVVAMLVPIIIPFNLAKGVINSVLICLLYKPITRISDKINVI